MTLRNPSRPASADRDKALDLWVHDSLCGAYGDVASEHLPDEWLRLLDAAPDEGREG